MAALAYYVFVLPLSYLPMWMIYGISNLLYAVLRFIYPYRRDVITDNLRKCFPEKSEKEITHLLHAFYRHFTDILAEGIKNLSISEKELRRRMKIKNPELMQQLYDEGKDVLLVSGHFNNWEWLITSQNFLLPHQAVGLGMPMSSKFWDKKINERRSRNGMIIEHSKSIRGFFQQKHDKPLATLMLADQSPGNSLKSYWMPFLGRLTAVQFGSEMLAHNHRQAVVFFATRKVKRGYYEIGFELICKDPAEMQWGEITEKHTRLLEAEILAHPEQWMWSHKRWKRELPENLELLREQQRASFNKLYNKS
ncbi:MAG: lysophospholipid acyltransferase family protein [Bacteroidota bacterium]